MYHAITSGAFHGMETFLVQVEVDVSNGIPCMDMVGCLAGEVKETKERVRVGIKNSGFEMPVKRITVSLSPADIRKDGSAFDLPVALGILSAVNLGESLSGPGGSDKEQGEVPFEKNIEKQSEMLFEKNAEEQSEVPIEKNAEEQSEMPIEKNAEDQSEMPFEKIAEDQTVMRFEKNTEERTAMQSEKCTREKTDNKTTSVIVLGELGLDGNVKGVRGILPTLLKAAEEKITSCIIPYDNRLEASNVKGMHIYPVKDLKEAYQIYEAIYNADIDFLRDRICNSGIENHVGTLWAGMGIEDAIECKDSITLDFGQVYGQEHAKRAALIAAAGFHNLLLFGPPGSGKSMIAERIPSIMPDMTYEECIDVTKIYSVAGLLDDKTTLVTKRPFMRPHHTVTDCALVGGGSTPRPGMVTLAHKGILFLDELPEFGRGKLDLLRQPLEEKKVQISRMLYTCNYQSDFMLVAAMNPCPCGFYPDRNKCNCRGYEIERYLNNISGPLLDRIDLSVEVGRMKWEQIFGEHSVRNQPVVSQSIRNQPAVGQSISGQLVGNQSISGQSVGNQSINNRLVGERTASVQRLGKEEKLYAENNRRFVWDSAHMRELSCAAVERQMKRNGCYNGALTGEAIEQCCVMTPEAEQFLKYAFDKMELSMRSLLRLKKVARTIADLEGTDKITQIHISEAIMLNKGLERLKRKKVAD